MRERSPVPSPLRAAMRPLPHHWCVVLLIVVFPCCLPFFSTFCVAHPPCCEHTPYPSYILFSLFRPCLGFVVAPASEKKKERKQTTQGRDGRTVHRHHTGILRRGECGASRHLPLGVCLFLSLKFKERKKTDNPREGWEDGTPPPHRDFKEGRVWC